MTSARYYAVSSGDGNNGISHLFPDYVVKTDQPWRLAELAAITSFKAGKGQIWAKENVQIDGEADYTISAVFYESPETQEQRDEMQATLDSYYDERAKLSPADKECEDSARLLELDDLIESLESEIEAFGDDSAWLIVDVFPFEDDDDFNARHGRRPTYESLDECFGADVVRAAF